MSLNYVELTLDLYDGQGNPVTQGTATLTPTQVLTDTTDHQITGLTPVTATFRPGSSPPVVKLLATDNSAPLPAGWAWTITPPPACGVAAFSFFLPYASGSSQYLSAQIPVGSPSGLSQYVLASELPLSLANGGTAAATAAAARTSLGLGTAATQASTAFDAAGAATAALGSAEAFTTAGFLQGQINVTAAGPPPSGTWAKGQLSTDGNGVAWVCTTGGTPGTWALAGSLQGGTWYLDQYAGTDDQKMTSAMSALFAASAFGLKGGTIVLSPRAHSFANQWSTSYSSGVVTPVRILGAGATVADIGAGNAAGATTATMSYAGGGAARMDFQHIGSIEITGICFQDSGGSPVPFLQTTNAVPNIHDNAFVGSATGTSCFQDAIVLGGGTGTVGGGDTAAYQGYQGQIYRNGFSGIRRIVYFQADANSVEVHENLVTQGGSNLQLGACVELNGASGSCTGNHVWGNCVEIGDYGCFVKATAGAVNNTFGPNGLFDANPTMVAYYIIQPNGFNYFNQVIDGYKNDAYPLILDGTGQTTFQTTHQTQWSYTPQPQIFGEVSFSYAQDVFFCDLQGDVAQIYPIVDAAGSGGYATIALASGNCTQVTDGQIYLNSNWITSATASFASGDLFKSIYGTGTGVNAFIARVATPSTAIPWFPSGVYALGDVTRPATANGHLYQATTAGTASSSQPAWPTGGGTVTDGTVVWQDLGTAATAAFTSFRSTATASGVTIRWGRIAATDVHAQFKRYHFLSQGSAPSGAADAGAGSSPSGVSTTGTDHAFTFSITTGTATASGDMFHVAPATAWTGTPNFMITAGNAATAALLAGGYWTTNTSGTLTLYTVNAPSTATAHVFHVTALV